MKTITIILLSLAFFASATKAQPDSEKLWIAGEVKVLIGSEIVIPLNVFVEIEQLQKIEPIDNLGKFRFDDLMPGDYKIKVHGFNYSSFDTLVTIKNKSIRDLQLIFIADCEVNKEVAELDIKEGTPKLLLIGGIAPIVIMDQYKFEEKYEIEYIDYGCTPPAQECVEQYNERIFQYLDSRYGKAWRREVRKDVIGFKE